MTRGKINGNAERLAIEGKPLPLPIGIWAQTMNIMIHRQSQKPHNFARRKRRVSMLGTYSLVLSTLVLLLGCAGVNSVDKDLSATSQAGKEDDDGGVSPFNLEDVFVFKSTPTSGSLPVTAFCTKATGIPSTHSFNREVTYEYTSIKQRTKSGLVVQLDQKIIGTHHGCYTNTVDGVTWAYVEGEFNGKPFKAVGSCSVSVARAPQPGVVPYTCGYAVLQMDGYIGGNFTFNGMSTTNRGYLNASLGSLRAWKQP